MAVLRCTSCNETQPVPKHCGQDMRLDKVDGVEMLVCHMGAGCAKQEIPRHHGVAMALQG